MLWLVLTGINWRDLLHLQVCTRMMAVCLPTNSFVCSADVY
jgi:hypothetical protein